jgi:hypothetical protein
MLDEAINACQCQTLAYLASSFVTIDKKVLRGGHQVSVADATKSFGSHSPTHHFHAFIKLQAGWTEDLKKICPIFLKVVQKVSKAKKAKISTTELNLKAQNIYIKPLFKPYTYSKPCFETTYLGESVINLLQKKVVQNFDISLGYFILKKS